ncbi:MAG: pyridoxal phosphate-dependent aminotransferase [Bacteroidales bacterium]|nr:pyridoxal phosphate-dependent aminotransferase [Candidatus Cryptobacteroides onthequi]
MTYDFEEIIDRRGTDCYKHELLEKVCGRTDVLPMWVADMEYRTPAFVTDAVQKRLGQGILGYTRPTAAYFQAICDWNKSEYGLDITPEMINYIPGVVSGIYMSMLAFTEKHDRILILEPVYHPFRLVPQANEREVVMSPLRRGETNFELDFERFEQDIKGCKMMVLCNPHNPGGVCWTADELRRIASICKREGVVVVSDEIHCDMLLGGRRHVPFASVSDEARSIAITLQAPTKTFNLPGIVAAHAIVLDEKLRERYFAYVQGSDMDLGNIFAFDCVRACYSDQGREWKAQMLAHVEGNVRLLCERMAAECPQIVPIVPEASFLVFIDCRALGMGTDEMIRFFADKAHIAMNPGVMFGPGGEGYMRMNVACPRSMMNQAIDQIVAAVKER